MAHSDTRIPFSVTDPTTGETRHFVAVSRLKEKEGEECDEQDERFLCYVEISCQEWARDLWGYYLVMPSVAFVRMDGGWCTLIGGLPSYYQVTNVLEIRRVQQPAA
jgi:hypothetical protein